jgi:hypothetical protein
MEKKKINVREKREQVALSFLPIGKMMRRLLRLLGARS